MTIRNALDTDLDALEELEKACFSVPWSRQSFAFEVKSPDGLVFLAEEDGAIVGFGVLHLFSDEAELFNLCVAENARRRGIAGALLEHLREEGAKWGVRRILLEVRQSNAAARALYRKHGFEVMGLRKNYYDLPKEDAILMELILDSYKK